MDRAGRPGAVVAALLLALGPAAAAGQGPGNIDPHNFQVQGPSNGQRPDGGWNYDPVQQFLLDEKSNMETALQAFEKELDELRQKVNDNVNNLGAEVQQLQGGAEHAQDEYNKCRAKTSQLTEAKEQLTRQYDQVLSQRKIRGWRMS